MKRLIISLLGILLIAAVTYGIIRYLEMNKPEVTQKEKVTLIPVVDTVTVRRQDAPIILRSEGVVEARRESVISAQVSGKITELHPNFEIGGSFREGELIALIDPLDYETAVAQARGSVAEAKLQFQLEKARAEQALRDWKKIGQGKVPGVLVQRKPYLEKAEATIASTEAALEKALEDLDRTRIRAPFDSRVRETVADVGQVLARGAKIGVVYDPEQYLIRLPLSLDDFAALPTSAETILRTEIAGRTYEWTGRIMWAEGDLDRTTLSAFLMAEVLPNEDHGERFRLPPAGLFLEGEVRGATLKGVIPVPREAVRGKDQVLVINEDHLLERRKIVPLRSTAEEIYTSAGLADGERVILTKLELPVEGMKLNIREDVGSH